MLSPSSLPPISPAWVPWVRPCACVGSGPKKIGRSVGAPEAVSGRQVSQPTPPPHPRIYRPPEMVTGCFQK